MQIQKGPRVHSLTAWFIECWSKAKPELDSPTLMNVRKAKGLRDAYLAAQSVCASVDRFPQNQ